MVKVLYVRLFKWILILFVIWINLYIITQIFSSFSFRNYSTDYDTHPDNTGKHWVNDADFLKNMLSHSSNINSKLSATTLCAGKFNAYASRFARLFDVVLDPGKGKGRPGGEKIETVLHQTEDVEYFQLKQGYFRLSCPRPWNKIHHYMFKLGPKNHLNQYLKALEFDDIPTDLSVPDPSTEIPYFLPRNTTVMVVTRYEYANFYHTLTDFYNVYHNGVLLGLDFNSVQILILDSHPEGSLDEVWKVLFGGISRAGQIKSAVKIHDMVWVNMGYLSPLMLHKAPNMPLVEEFRDFFYSRFNTSPALVNRKYDCSRGVTVLFVWRRDYLAHPRNPGGHVSRKIKNEVDLVKTLRKRFAKTVIARIDAVQLDALPMDKQLDYVSKTDILIGMHGAGLSHSLFLAKTSGLVELYPRYWSANNVHFSKICQWRGLIYERFINRNTQYELPGKFTYIPPDVVVTLVGKVIDKMKSRCKKSHG